MKKNVEPKIIEKVSILNFPIERVYLYSTNFSLISFTSQTNFRITKWIRTPVLAGEEFEGILEPFGCFTGKCIQHLNYLSHKKMKVQLIFDQAILTITKTFYKIIKNNTTLFYNKIKFRPIPSINNNNTSSFDYDLFEKLVKKTSINIIKEANQILSMSYLFLDQVESCLIKADLETIWETIKDINKLRKVSPFIDLSLDSLTFTEDKSENIIKVRYPNGYAILKVIEDYQPKCRTCSLTMDFIWGEPKIPLQTMSYILNRTTKIQTQILFKHEFKEPISNEYINFLVKRKKAILKDLQTFFNPKVNGEGIITHYNKNGMCERENDYPINTV